MLTVSISELKANLSAYIKKVQQGQTIVVTLRGCPIADLAPHIEKDDIETRMKVLVDAGVVLWNGEKLMPVKPVVLNHTDKLVSDVIVEMRNESLY